MLKMRLQRVGRRNDPSFRVVVIDGREGPRSGKAVEQIGHYNPKTKSRDIDVDRAKYWLSVGAQPSGTVHNMLVSAKILDAQKINVLPQKTPVLKEQPEEETASAPAPEATAGDDASSEEASAPAEEMPAEPTPEPETPADDAPAENAESEEKEEQPEATE